MATQEYTQLDSPIRFPQSGVDWKDANSGSVTVPARSLETGDTLEYKETRVVYTYDSAIYTWTGDFISGGAPLVVSLTWANALDEFKKDNEVVAVTGVGTDGALTDGVSYKYEWYRQDPADDISTSIKTETVTDNFTSYTLTDDDVGFVIWVSVEATDVDGNVATANTPKNGEVGAPDPIEQPDPEVIYDDMTPMYWYHTRQPAGVTLYNVYYYFGKLYGVFGALSRHKVYRSEDGGLTWDLIFETAEGSGPASNAYVKGLHVFSYSCSNLYVWRGTFIWKSEDEGDTWTRHDTPYGMNMQCAFGDANPDAAGTPRLIALTDSNPFAFHLWETTDLENGVWTDKGVASGSPTTRTALDAYVIRDTTNIGSDNAAGNSISRLVVKISDLTDGNEGCWLSNAGLTRLVKYGTSGTHGTTGYDAKLTFTNVEDDQTLFSFGVYSANSYKFSVDYWGPYNGNNTSGSGVLHSLSAFDASVMHGVGFAGTTNPEDINGFTYSPVISMGYKAQISYTNNSLNITPETTLWNSSNTNIPLQTGGAGASSLKMLHGGAYHRELKRFVIVEGGSRLIFGSPYRIPELETTFRSYTADDGFVTSDTFTVLDTTTYDVNGIEMIDYEIQFDTIEGADDLRIDTAIHQEHPSGEQSYIVKEYDASTKTIIITKRDYAEPILTDVGFHCEYGPIVATLNT